MPKTLLLADDSVTIQRVIELTFADEDIQVVAVGDGQQAIDRIKANRPDIVLADTGMPERDGYQVAAFVKGDPALASIPVVLLTGAFEPLDERRAQQIGCDGVLVKPFEPQLVISRVRELLDRQTAGVPSAPQPEAAPLSETRPAAIPAPPAADDRSSDKPSRRESSGAALDPAPPNELDDYFDQLDEAFASLDPGGPKPAWPAAGARRDDEARPVREVAVSAATFQTPPVETPHDFGEWDLDTLSHGGSGPGAPDPLASSEPISPVPVSTPAREPAYQPDVSAAPLPASSPAAIPVVPAHDADSGPLANAFAALLAAEQGMPGSGPAAVWAPHAMPEVTDELVDDLAQRVLERLTDRVIREAVSDAVGGVAERLVREEIERIKSGA